MWNRPWELTFFVGKWTSARPRTKAEIQDWNSRFFQPELLAWIHGAFLLDCLRKTWTQHAKRILAGRGTELCLLQKCWVQSYEKYGYCGSVFPQPSCPPFPVQTARDIKLRETFLPVVVSAPCWVHSVSCPSLRSLSRSCVLEPSVNSPVSYFRKKHLPFSWQHGNLEWFSQVRCWGSTL